MDRIKELNEKNSHILQPYKKLALSNTKFINSNLGYYLGIGLAIFITSFTMNFQAQGNTGADPQVSGIALLLMSILSMAVYLLIVSWTINLYRSAIERTTNKDLSLTKSSFIPEFDGNFFKRGLKFFASTFIIGMVVGVVIGIIALFTVPLFIGGSGIALGLAMESSVGGIIGLGLGIILAFLVFFLLIAVVATLLSPFIMPLTTLYVYYGDDLGVFEAIGISFKMGASNYGLLLKASIKRLLLQTLGLMLFGVGLIYTSVWAMFVEIDAVSSILGVTLAEGKTFKGDHEVVTVEGTQGDVYATQEVEQVEPEDQETEVEGDDDYDYDEVIYTTKISPEETVEIEDEDVIIEEPVELEEPEAVEEETVIIEEEWEDETEEDKE